MPRSFHVLRSVYFRRLFGTFLIMILLIGVFLFFLSSTNLPSTMKSHELSSVQEQLLLLAPHAKKVFQNTDYEGSQDIFSKEYPTSQTRFTLIAPRGEIIADSHNLPDTTVRGWELPEVERALQEPWGIYEREVPLFQEKNLLVAMAIRHEGKVIGVVRGELPLSFIKQLTLNVQQTLLGIALLGALLAFLFGFFMAKSHAEPIAQMAEVCRAIQSGDYSKQVTLLPRNEIGQLANTLNDLSQNILSKISSLSLERAQLKSMLACMREGIISVSDRGEILFCNLATYTHMGLPTQRDLRTLSIRDLEELKPLHEIWKSVVRDRKFKVKELTYQPSHHDGAGAVSAGEAAPGGGGEGGADGAGGGPGPAPVEPKYLQVYATFYESSPEGASKDAGVMIVIDNHTEIKKLQQMRRDFFAHVSHELKTPLTSIQGYVETLQGGAYSDPQVSQRFLTKIESNTKRMISLVMDLLSLTKIDTRTAPLALRPLQWLPVVHKVVENHETAIQKRSLTLDIKPLFGSLLIMGNYESMYTIIDNLLANAIRYSKERSKIAIWFSKRKGVHFLHVTDTGVGIAREHQPAIFQRFYRVDKARSRQEGGTGLGLAIVKLLAEKMGGEVSVASELGIGSTFSVGLPRVF